MIDQSQLGLIIESLRPKFKDFDEHVIRLHLMAYSVFEQIYRSKVGWQLLKQIEWGYHGLLREEVLVETMRIDPFGIRGLPVHDLDSLHALIHFQVEQFRDQSRQSVYSDEYESYAHLIDELAVLDSDAVGSLTPPESFGQSIDALKENFNSLILSNEQGERTSINHKRFTRESYYRHVDWLLTEFYFSDHFLRPDKILDEIVAGLSVNGVGSIYCLYPGVGNVFHSLRQKFPNLDLYSVKIQSRNTCESFLCEINLWPLSEYLCEPWVITHNNPVLERQEELKETEESGEDIVIGVISEDELMEKATNRHIFKLSHGCTEVESQYIELLLSYLDDKGQAYVAMPQRFLYSFESRITRDYHLSQGWIKSISEVPNEDTGSSFGSMVIVHFNLDGPCPDGAVVFRSGETSTSLSVSRIRESNPSLDLRPSRFLNSIQYRYSDVFSLFELGILDQKIRPDLINIISAVEGTGELRNLFNPVRKVLEAVYYHLLMREPEDSEWRRNRRTFVTPDGGVHFEEVRKFLNGEKIEKRVREENILIKRQKGRLIPPDVNASAITVQKLTNRESHYYKQGGYSDYAFKSSVHSLLHLLQWFGDHVQKAKS